MSEFTIGFILGAIIFFFLTLNVYESWVVNRCINHGELTIHPIVIECSVKVNK